MPRHGIPDRWLEYKSIGERIEGTRLIAFKVPLGEQVNKNVNKNDRLDKNILLQHIPNLGLIIDLTNTTRYYKPYTFENQGIKHKKIEIPGRILPAKNLVQTFIQYVIDFLNENENNDKLIGVHCTHGVNRTGYLICKYLISELNITPVDAIARFSAARGHSIERSNYVDDLYKVEGAKSLLPETKSLEPTQKTDNKYSRNKKDNLETYQSEREKYYFANTDRRSQSWRSGYNQPQASLEQQREPRDRSRDRRNQTINNNLNSNWPQNTGINFLQNDRVAEKNAPNISNWWSENKKQPREQQREPIDRRDRLQRCKDDVKMKRSTWRQNDQAVHKSAPNMSNCPEEYQPPIKQQKLPIEREKRTRDNGSKRPNSYNKRPTGYQHGNPKKLDKSQNTAHSWNSFAFT